MDVLEMLSGGRDRAHLAGTLSGEKEQSDFSSHYRIGVNPPPMRHLERQFYNRLNFGSLGITLAHL